MSGDGYWQVDHADLSAALSRADLPGECLRVYLALADLTLGYGKARDVVSLGQIAEATGIAARHVRRALKRLTSLGLYGQHPERGHSAQSVTRWVVWPAPPMSGTPEAGTPEAGNTGIPKGTPKGTPEAGNHQDSKPPKKKPTGDKRPSDPRVQEFIGWFCERFRAVTAIDYVVKWKADGAIVKGLLTTIDLPELQRAADTMLADPWWQSKASFGVLSSRINEWRQGAKGKAGNAVSGRGHYTPPADYSTADIEAAYIDVGDDHE